MLIPNSLRMEHMPKMVYALVKLVESNRYTENDLRKIITATTRNEYDDSSWDRFNLIHNFACEAEMISEKNGYYITEFTGKQLTSFSEFTYALLGKMTVHKDNMFDALLKCYLKSDYYIESEFTTSASKYREKAIEDVNVKRFHVEEDNIHGFFFWIEAFEIANFESNRSGHVYYCLENLLIKYIERHPELKQKGSLPTKLFIEELTQDLYFIPFCCEGNNITYPLSQALRILENMEMIDLEYRQDSDQIWHLTNSEAFVKGNRFSNVRVH